MRVGKVLIEIGAVGRGNMDKDPMDIIANAMEKKLATYERSDFDGSKFLVSGISFQYQVRYGGV